MSTHILAALYMAALLAGGYVAHRIHVRRQARAAERAWEQHVQDAFDLAAAHHAGLIVLPTPDLASFGVALLDRETAAFRRDLDAWGQA